MRCSFLFALFCALPAVTGASPLTVDFNVTSSPLSLNYPVGISGSGEFTFQDDFLPAPGTTFFETQSGLPLVNAKVHWFGKSFDESTLRLYNLQTDDSGKLIGWGIGIAGCGTPATSRNFNVVCSSSSFDDFWAAIYDDGKTHSALSGPGVNGIADGVGDWRIKSVPEPDILGLMTLGLLMTGWACHPRKR